MGSGRGRSNVRTRCREASSWCSGRRGQDEEDLSGHRQFRSGDARLQGRHHRRRRRKARHHPRQGQAGQRDHMQRVPSAARPAVCRSPSWSRTARLRSSRPSATCFPTRWWCGAKRTAPISSAIRIFAKGQLFPQADRRVLPQDQGQELEGKAARLRRSADALRGRGLADRAVQSGQADAGAGAVSRPSGVGGLWPRRGVENLSRDAAHRTPRLPRAREGMAARRRHARRFQGRVRLRLQRAACCSRTSSTTIPGA